MAAKIRLIKIASEINIGKDAIVQFLEQKGFSIENKPTAILSPEMVEAVYDKFKKELKIIEKQREKLEKLKQSRKSSVEAKKTKTETETEIPSKPDVIEKQVLEPQVVITPKPEKSDFLGDLIEEIDSVRPAKPKEEKVVAKGEKELIEDIKPQPQEAIDKIESSKEKEEKVGIAPKTDESAIAEKEVKQDKTKEKPVKTKRLEDDNKQKDEIKKSAAEQSASQRINKNKRNKKKAPASTESEPKKKTRIKELTIIGKIDLNELDSKKKIHTLTKKVKADAEPKPLDKVKEKYYKKFKGAKTIVIDGSDKKEGKRKRKKSIKDEISTEDIDRAIRETLSGMEESTSSITKTKLRMKKKAQREEKEQKILEEKLREEKVLQLSEFVTTNDLANMMGVNPNEIILKCLGLGLMVTINQRLDKDSITLIADDYGLDVEFLDEKAMQMIEEEENDPPELMKTRPPIVTIMGHVDHGKTSLLDFIRKANVVAGESGGITQHIGAYQVELPENKFITFLDTPGHEAFTAMRARGALVTDIVVLVVAADDSVMPQTIEAISHAQAANVPIIVAINKIDKPDANPERIKQQLTDYNVLVEEWGGKNQSVELSAKKGINIESLLEKILLEAELLDLKANPDRLAKGTIIEANMDRGLGAVSTVIVQNGTLKIGDYFVAGTLWGRVRAMFDERGNKVDIAGPSMPVRVIGFNGLPEAGDLINAVEAEYMAKEIANDRNRLKRQQEFKRLKHVTLDQISKQIQEGGIKDLNLIIKADVGGSAEALSDSLFKLATDEVRVNILHKSVGSINESDVMLAIASGAVIIGFHVNPTGSARKLADANSIDIRLYSIIYDCIEEIRLALEGMLTPDLKEDVTAEVEIRKVYKISKIGSVCGCYVLSGKISRNDKVRVLRDGLPIFTGTISSLKRGKDDVKEVDTSFECGIMLNNFNAVEPGDIIESYKIVEVKRTL